MSAASGEEGNSLAFPIFIAVALFLVVAFAIVFEKSGEPPADPIEAEFVVVEGD